MSKLAKRKPARLMSEKEVLQKLGIPDFRHLSKKTAVQFISSIPQMDPEVAKKALDQFPELANMALGIAKEYKEGLQSSFESNDKTTEASLTIINGIIEVLTEQLNKEGLTSEEKLLIVDCLTKLAGEIRGINKDNQNFLLKGLGIFAGVVASVVVGTVAVLGANGRVELPDMPDGENGEA